MVPLETQWSHVHPNSTEKQCPKRSQNEAEMESIEGANGAIGDIGAMNGVKLMWGFGSIAECM